MTQPYDEGLASLRRMAMNHALFSRHNVGPKCQKCFHVLGKHVFDSERPTHCVSCDKECPGMDAAKT